MQCRGMAPPPAQGKPRAARPRLERPTGLLALLGLGFSSSPHPPWVTSVCLSALRGASWTVGWVDCPWPVVGGLERLRRPRTPCSSPSGPPPTPGPPVASQLHLRAQVAMTVTVWSCPGQKTGPLRTVAPGAWARGSRLPTAARSGPSPLAALDCGARPSRTGNADPVDTARKGRKVTSPTWAPEPPSQRLRAPRMSPALGLPWLGR